MHAGHDVRVEPCLLQRPLRARLVGVAELVEAAVSWTKRRSR